MPTPSPDFSFSSQNNDVPDALTSPVSTDEPMYEGEECVNAVAPVSADKEPVYEGESLLGKSAEKSVGDCSSEGKPTDGLTAEQGKLYTLSDLLGTHFWETHTCLSLCIETLLSTL